MQYVLRFLVPIFIALVPCFFSFSTLDPTLATRFLFLSVCVVIFLIISLMIKFRFEKSILNHKVVWLSFFLIATYFISSLYNGFSSVSIYEVLKLFLFFVFLIILTQYIIKFGYYGILKSVVFFSLITSFFYFAEFLYVFPNKVDQIAATMGHKNLLCSIHFLSLPFLIYLCYVDRTFFRFLSFLAVLLIIVIFSIAQSRAVLLALIVFGGCMFFVYGKKMITYKSVGVFIISSVLFFGAIYIYQFNENNVDTINKKIERTINFQNSPRYHLYQSTIDLIKQNPVFGVGPGRWKIEIPKYNLYSGDKIEVKYSQGDFFAQRPHNDILWIFAEAGVIACLLYVVLFLFLIRLSYHFTKNQNNKESVLFALLCATIAGYFVISFFDFPFERISHNIFFTIISAIIIAKSIKHKSLDSGNFFKPLPHIFLVCMSLVVYAGCTRYSGEKAVNKIKKYQNSQQWDLVVQAVSKGYNKYFFEIDNTATPISWFSGVAYFNNNKIDSAFIEFQKAYSINPYHVHVMNNLATCYHLKGDTEQAIKLYDKSLMILPTFKESRINLASIYYNKKKFTKSLDVILKSRIDSYDIRKKTNDRYDFYLNKIVNSYIDSVYLFCGQKDQWKLDSLRNVFNANPDIANQKMRDALGVRMQKDISYARAIFLDLNN